MQQFQMRINFGKSLDIYIADEVCYNKKAKIDKRSYDYEKYSSCRYRLW